MIQQQTKLFWKFGCLKLVPHRIPQIAIIFVLFCLFSLNNFIVRCFPRNINKIRPWSFCTIISWCHFLINRDGCYLIFVGTRQALVLALPHITKYRPTTMIIAPRTLKKHQKKKHVFRNFLLPQLDGILKFIFLNDYCCCPCS